MVIANTIKGKGVKEIEGDFKYHAVPLTIEQLDRASKAFLLRMEEIDQELPNIPTSFPRRNRKDISSPFPDNLKEIISRTPRTI